MSVKDGDTIEVLHNRKPERIRLTGIDCPEKKQAFGTRAKQATSSLSFGQQVTIQTTGKDWYGRTLASLTRVAGDLWGEPDFDLCDVRVVCQAAIDDRR